MYRKILIANRGEIACRIARTLRRMGIAAATVHSSADAQALHVREIGESVWIGDAPARQSYLQIEAVIAAARQVGADAIHPGFGFLSENAAFARRCGEEGLAFIGPSPEVLALFGDKSQAKQLAQSLGIVTAGGLAQPSDDIPTLVQALSTLPRPCILKAVAGGGGKGMRVVQAGDDVEAAIASAIREGLSAFGDGRLIAERYLRAPRHIEVQILGDGQGEVMHLWDRECSLQRRFQKVVEEAPVSAIDPDLRTRLQAQAIALGQAVKYLGLGTVEFAVSGDEAVFLEVNPRLQVEHTVTEAITGLDLVELQIRTVHDRALALTPAQRPTPQGVAVQMRLYAEDASQGFLPATGRIGLWSMPSGVRVDAGVDQSDEITPHYDPMMAKLIAHGPDRAAALDTARQALAQTRVLGVAHNRDFLRALLAHARVQANEVHTEFVDEWLKAHPPKPLAASAVAALMGVWLVRTRAQNAHASSAGGAWQDERLTGWRLRRSAIPPPCAWLVRHSSGQWQVGFAAGHDGTLAVRVDDAVFDVGVSTRAGALQGPHGVTVQGQTWRVDMDVHGHALSADFEGQSVALDLLPLVAQGLGGADGTRDKMRAPMMGMIIGVHVKAGEMVEAGQRLATLESMKMEMPVTAPMAGRVTWVGCAERDKVERHQDLFRIEAVTP